jgi:3-methyladenine DNA glycosylase AlkD
METNKASLFTTTDLETDLSKSPQNKVKTEIFFKTAPGQYSHHDKFLNINVPYLRKLSKKYQYIPLHQTNNKLSIQLLLNSEYNEKRLLALFILILKYDKSQQHEKTIIYDYYVTNIDSINNWNLVDASAHLIIGAYLFHHPNNILEVLTNSSNLWHRRIAIVSTLYSIRQNTFNETLKICEKLMNDKEDLIHKACGWMLREVGKKDLSVLISFLNQFATQMPRTMLRYAIERLSKDEQKYYLQVKPQNSGSN